MIKTNFPAKRASSRCSTSRPRSSKADMDRVVLGPGYTDRSSDPSVYMLVPDMKKFAREVGHAVRPRQPLVRATGLTFTASPAP